MPAAPVSFDSGLENSSHSRTILGSSTGVAALDKYSAEAIETAAGYPSKEPIAIGREIKDTKGMGHFRTLVVDDMEDFRRLLCSALQERTECEVVGEASDGLQAVLQAERLQPDLILLDIGLPSLNGIQAARRIRKLLPNTKILFFTQNCSHEIAQGALRTGANGYLLKSDATNLPFAVDAVLRGEQFVSSRVQAS